MMIHVTEPYLWLPVDKKKSQVKLHFYCSGIKFQEIDIQLGGTDCDFYATMDVSRYLNREIEIKGEIPEDMLYHIFCCGEKAQHIYPFRPKMHFTPEVGWHNDPNGLVFADGVYHLYYQWNPYGVAWGNMHWGHAVSRDLINWEHKPMAMEPDEHGTVYSGCGFQDKENAAGFGKNTLLFMYTAAGGSNQWSADMGHRHTQRLAVSVDGGNTLQRVEGAVLAHIAGDNRDPKILFHKESGAYIMVLYLEENEFAVFRSDDLLHWVETQRFSAEGMWECPDLFELPVDNEAGEKKWVFWSADGYYLIGNFDGYRFTPESGVQSAYSTKLPYAAQTYAGVSDRVISLAWYRMKNDRGNYRGVMSLPAELSLVKQGENYRIRFQPVSEFYTYRQFGGELKKNRHTAEIELTGTPMEVTIVWKPQKEGRTKLSIGSTIITIDFNNGIMEFRNPQIDSDTIVVPFDRQRQWKLDLVIDQEVIEFYGDDGVVYGAVETEENVLRRKLLLESTVEMDSVKWYELGGNQ